MPSLVEGFRNLWRLAGASAVDSELLFSITLEQQEQQHFRNIAVCHRHKGPYGIRIATHNQLPVGQIVAPPKLHISIRFATATSKQISFTTNNLEFPYWSNTDFGYLLYRYRVPEFLPKKLSIQCFIDVEVINQDVPVTGWRLYGAQFYDK
jgi:hypothetical protein